MTPRQQASKQEKEERNNRNLDLFCSLAPRPAKPNHKPKGEALSGKMDGDGV
jgi:hypothetical protein